jgi:hypothetical protein
MKVLYDSGPMDVGGRRSREIVSRTRKGIKVEYDSLYESIRGRIEYYWTGYPEIPEDWHKRHNEYVTAADFWFHLLESYRPDRIVRK